MRTESETKKHESYGLLSLSRIQVSPPCALFGSSIRHGNTISLRISEGIERRDFQRSWYMDGERFIEVEMSAAQFAEAITTLNVGCGVPVTVRYVKGDEYDKDNRRFRENPPEINFKDRAQSELKSEMMELGERIEELSKDAKEVLERKGTTIKAGEKEKLLRDLMFLVQEIRSNIPFAHECFQKSVEHTVVEAKSEVDSCMTAMREKLGQAVLDHKIEIPMLEDK